MQGSVIRAAAFYAGAMILACTGFTALAQPPIEYSGAVELSVMSRRLPSDASHEFGAEVFAFSHISSYLWQPWIATVDADLNVSYETDTDWGFGEATSIAGDFLLSALPSSQYPFQLFFSASDNRFDGDFSGSDYTRLRAGISGRAALSERFSLDYLFSHDEFDRDSYGDLSAQRGELALRGTFNVGEAPLNITNAGASVSYYNTDFKGRQSGGSRYLSESLAGTIYYRAAPNRRTNHDFSATVISDKGDNSQGGYDRLLGQGVGTLQWRSPSNDLTATGALRMTFQEIDHDYFLRSSNARRGLMAANAGINWRAAERLNVTLGARAEAEQIGDVVDDGTGLSYEPTRHNYVGGLLGTIDYRSLSKDVSGFKWHWDARAVGDLTYNTNRAELARNEITNGPRSDASASIGHTFERSVELPVVKAVDFTFQQEGGFRHYSSDEKFKPTITHSASISKSVSDEHGSSYFRFYLRDTHAFGTFGSEAEEYQTAQLDFTRQVQLTGKQSLNGSLSAQLVHQSRHRRDEIYIFSRADVQYEYRDINDIDGLNFTSGVRLNSLGLHDLIYDWRDELSPDLFRNDWRNRLSYTIGQLSLALEGTLFEDNGRLGHYVRFTGRRSFDSIE